MELDQIETTIAENKSKISNLEKKESELEHQLKDILADGKEPKGHEVILKTITLEVARLKVVNLTLEMEQSEIVLSKKRNQLLHIYGELIRLDNESEQLKQKFSEASVESRTIYTKLNLIASQFSQLEQEGKRISAELGVKWISDAHLHNLNQHEIKEVKMS